MRWASPSTPSFLPRMSWMVVMVLLRSMGCDSWGVRGGRPGQGSDGPVFDRDAGEFPEVTCIAGDDDALVGQRDPGDEDVDVVDRVAGLACCRVETGGMIGGVLAQR